MPFCQDCGAALELVAQETVYVYTCDFAIDAHGEPTLDALPPMREGQFIETDAVWVECPECQVRRFLFGEYVKVCIEYPAALMSGLREIAEQIGEDRLWAAMRETFSKPRAGREACQQG